MSGRTLMSRARYHHWANAQLNDFLLAVDHDGGFAVREDVRENVRQALAHTMTVDGLWLDRLEGSNHASTSQRRFAALDLDGMLKARTLLDARLMAAVQRIGPVASDETVEAANGLRIGLTSVVRFMLARNQRQRSRIAAMLTELNLTPPLIGVQLFESRSQKQTARPATSRSIDSRMLVAVG